MKGIFSIIMIKEVKQSKTFSQVVERDDEVKVIKTELYHKAGQLVVPLL
jgi:hypothetical protein